MNALKILTVVLALTVTATLAGCATATPTPEVPTTPSATTQPEVPTEAPTEVPSGVDSLWSADEVSVLAKTSDRVELTVTVWDGKSLTGPTAHPFLGGGDFTITMPDEWYGSADMIAVPFRIEVVNAGSDTLPGVVLGGNVNTDTEVFATLEGEDTEYRTANTVMYITAPDETAPGQQVAVSGYLLVPVDYVFIDGYASFFVRGADEDIDASIVWNDPFERYMPREAAGR